MGKSNENVLGQASVCQTFSCLVSVSTMAGVDVAQGGLVCACARGVQCPVLTQRWAVLPGTDGRITKGRGTMPAIVLGISYTVSGTKAGSDTIRSL
eukprot:3104852-Rhodomonas_salina.3